MRLQGKNALVTGSSRGIGRGIALRFAQEGANVAINYVGSRQAAEDTQKEVEAFGVRSVILPADISSASEVRANRGCRNPSAFGGPLPLHPATYAPAPRRARRGAHLL